MRRELRKRPEAEEDLLEIWDYTSNRWGDEQADRYIDEIDTALNGLREYPLLSTDCSNIRRGYRRVAVGWHRVYFTASDEVVEVIRVLHPRMNAKAKLRK